MKNGSTSYSPTPKKRNMWFDGINHRFEMQLLLEKAGFSAVSIIDESFEQNEQAVVYVA